MPDSARKEMPMIGIGTWEMKSEVTLEDVIRTGLETGYRLIDTAQVYGNEGSIGRILEKVLPELGLTREDIFITSKLSPSNAGVKKATSSVIKSLEKLKTDYLDLLLIHWPGSRLKSEDEGNRILRRESWEALTDLMQQGKLREIGVSNFEVKHLEELKSFSNVLPAVNQVEFHPHFHQIELLKYCRENQIKFQAYSSLGSPNYREKLFEDHQVQRLAKKYDVSVPVFLLAWAYSQKIGVLPRTSNKSHVIENYNCIKIHISQEDIDILLYNDKEKKTCWDPRVVI
ncbi:unnamed protein product [Caenorhabditis auriculariae]|uniref:NADP-dependent oxidoreductase domain-containing protein n=1 Tax=Caenorhabditis auriculariae TaxID=2777116 RepID=A0A8S1H039_9PELO|nr:unnamed protein product [Caenorhabditis auriculariae]